MSLQDDLVTFLDGGSVIPFYGEYKYIPKPNHIDELVEYQFKRYYRSYNKYFVGSPSSSFVRLISAKDFKLIKSLKEKENSVKNVSKKIQLVMNFL